MTKKHFNLFELMDWCSQRSIGMIIEHGDDVCVTFEDHHDRVPVREVRFGYGEYETYEKVLCEIAVEIDMEPGKQDIGFDGRWK